jgi:hypothetical protein
MAQKGIQFTLSDGSGTIDVYENDILYVAEDAATGNYRLSVDEGKDREVIYIVDESPSNARSAGSKLFLANLSGLGIESVIAFNADRVITISGSEDTEVIRAESTATISSGSGGITLLDNTANFSLPPEVLPGDILVNTSTNITTSVSSVKQPLPPPAPQLYIELQVSTVGAAPLEGETYEIYRSLSPAKILYDSIEVEKIWEVKESPSTLRSIINAL